MVIQVWATRKVEYLNNKTFRLYENNGRPIKDCLAKEACDFVVNSMELYASEDRHFPIPQDKLDPMRQNMWYTLGIAQRDVKNGLAVQQEQQNKTVGSLIDEMMDNFCSTMLSATPLLKRGEARAVLDEFLVVVGKIGFLHHGLPQKDYNRKEESIEYVYRLMSYIIYAGAVNPIPDVICDITEFLAYDSHGIIGIQGPKSADSFFESLTQMFANADPSEIRHPVFIHSIPDRWTYPYHGGDAESVYYPDPYAKSSRTYRLLTPVAAAAYFALIARDFIPGAYQNIIDSFAAFSAAIHQVSCVYPDNLSLHVNKSIGCLVIPEDGKKISKSEAMKILKDLSEDTSWPAMQATALECMAHASGPYKAAACILKAKKIQPSEATNVNLFGISYAYNRKAVRLTLGLAISIAAIIFSFVLAYNITNGIQLFMTTAKFSFGLLETIVIFVIIGIPIFIIGVISTIVSKPSASDIRRADIRAGVTDALYWSGHWRWYG